MNDGGISMRSSLNLIVVPLIFMATALCSCVAYAAVSPLCPSNDLTGKVINGRYHATNGWFNMPIPEYAEPCYIEDEYVEGRLWDVAFFNDYGYLLKVEVDAILPEVHSIITKHPEVKAEVLDAIFHEAVLTQIKSDAANTEILHTRSIILESGDPAFFVVLNLPRASSVVDRATGLSFDSKRGYLFVFLDNKHLLNLSMQDAYSLMPRFAESAKVNLADRLLKHLSNIQRTINKEK